MFHAGMIWLSFEMLLVYWKYKVPFIDLNKKSQQLLQELGPEKSKLLFLALGENPYYPKDEEDITHFNALGARKIAEIVLAELKALKFKWAEQTRISNKREIN